MADNKKFEDALMKILEHGQLENQGSPPYPALLQK
jgi:hypothetical protein